jgi:hypothetical protein
MAAAHRYTAPAGTPQKTPLPTVFQLLHEISVGTDSVFQLLHEISVGTDCEGKKQLYTVIPMLRWTTVTYQTQFICFKIVAFNRHGIVIAFIS